MKKIIFSLILIYLMSFTLCFAQTSDVLLPSEFKDIKIGMNYDDFKKKTTSSLISDLDEWKMNNSLIWITFKITNNNLWSNASVMLLNKKIRNFTFAFDIYQTNLNDNEIKDIKNKYKIIIENAIKIWGKKFVKKITNDEEYPQLLLIWNLKDKNIGILFTPEKYMKTSRSVSLSLNYYSTSINVEKTFKKIYNDGQNGFKFNDLAGPDIQKILK